MAATPQNQNNESEKPKTFEHALEELEEIVSQLEAGEKPLDESLELYEKGVAALRHCHAVLDKAEKRIRLLVKNNRGEPELSDSPVPDRKTPSSRRAAPVRENAQGQSSPQGAKNYTDEAAQEGSKNSGDESVDSEPPVRQNPEPSVKPKSRPASGMTDASGGSLFGNTE
ncbi:MAG TPA: exodeoxyribonuclease VII small subunit [Planctomycetota bacterium]|nr:exodeoxyribonuclease VII small subunit [Planctomycetota bacterium]